MGGKYSSLKFILPHIPKNISTFYDVFAGSGTVALNVRAVNYVLNDRVTPLVELHKYLITNGYQSTYDNIIQDIEGYSLNDLSGKGYLELRKKYNEDKDP